MRNPETVLVRVVVGLLEQAEELGLDRIDLVRLAGLDRIETQDPDARVPVSKHIALWHLIAQHAPDPGFGIRLGAALEVRKLGLVGYAMYYSSTLDQALRRLVRYSRIVNETLRLTLGRHGPHVALSVSDPYDLGPGLRCALDSRLALIVATARAITGRDIVPVKVAFPLGPPKTLVHHERFFHCPLEFNQPSSLVVLRTEDAALPVLRADADLVGYLDNHAESVLRGLVGSGSVTERVRAAVWTDLSHGLPTLADVAATLGTSPRTLQRQLGAEGTSFSEVVDAIRRDMAAACMGDQRLSIDEIAFLLGYADTTSFRRSFKRWTGQTPREYRRSSAHRLSSVTTTWRD
jgi:AraC-like DNA-binding protein